MVKNFKNVRNVLNMKKIVSAGIIAGTIFASTSAFAAPNFQSKSAVKYTNGPHIGVGSFNSQGNSSADIFSQTQGASSFSFFNRQGQNLEVTRGQSQGIFGSLNRSRAGK